MKPISFGSTYIVKNIHPEKFSKFKSLAHFEEDVNPDKTRFFIESKLEDKQRLLFSTKGTLIAPDFRDSSIESYCALQGISYTKLNTKNLMNVEAIKQRIAEPKNGMNMVEINAEKFEELVRKQDSNFQHCELDYKHYFKNTLETMLKKGEDIPVSTLYIAPNGSSDEDFINYVDFFGADLLNPNQIFICFAQFLYM